MHVVYINEKFITKNGRTSIYPHINQSIRKARRGVVLFTLCL